MGEIGTAITGLLNFRDVGGLPTWDGGRTRFRTLYRSHSLSGLDPEGMAEVRALGLRSVLDLRDEFETVQWPYEIGDPSIRRSYVPVLGNRPVPPGQSDLYVYMVEECGSGFTRAVRALADADSLPVLVHCAVGKDRTGVTVALALSAAGVTDEAIVTDFLRSNRGLDIPDPEQPDPADGQDAGSGDDVPDRYLTHQYVRPGLIESSLAVARRLGGDVPGYLAMHGMTDGELDALRANLTEPPS